MKKFAPFLLALVLLAGLSFVIIHRPANAPPPEDRVIEPPAPIANEKAERPDLVVVDSPRIHDTVQSPLTITGRARGTWFFEASFPVRLIDNQGKVLGQGHAQANGEWMTTDFVSFTAVLEFPQPTTETGVLILEKDNPSGNPDLSDELGFPVRFSPRAEGECRKTGCSGQICSDDDIASTCEYSETYACYQTAECKRQTDGRCGWTDTADLRACLDKNK